MRHDGSSAWNLSFYTPTSLNRASNPRPIPEERSESVAVGKEKFPDFDAASLGPGTTTQRHAGHVSGSEASPPNEGWTPRRASHGIWSATDDQAKAGAYGHRRQRSITSAIRHLRSGSVSQNAHEIADALRAPISYKLIFLCVAWYCSSALTNTSSKSILTAFDKPATLTLVQFALLSIYCMLSSWLSSVFPRLRDTVPALKYPIRAPSRDVIAGTLPLAAFQIGGHLLSAAATSKMPVSLGNILLTRPADVCALLATVIFVSQNIFSKKLFNEAARAEEAGVATQLRKLDKLNLLCYSSALAFILTLPIWLWSEGIDIVGDFLWDGSVDLVQAPNSFDHGRLTIEFIFNGTFHFSQNILAFVLLSMVSPVTYSVASLLKRVFVIIVAILWFRSPTTTLQAVGIALTFLGLYLYDRSSDKNKADQRARNLTVTKGSQPLLPVSAGQALAASQGTSVMERPVSDSHATTAYANGHSIPIGDDIKKSDGRNHVRGASHSGWLPKQEATWPLRRDGKATA
ncbi:hypothetical protein P8C59_005889 [Phyllachora maydis]|uniref:Sugar phosphate transporter domain-containing protein n=1 Tax=Phyllachora maydis TaxID=1825666 RepID=A0AAD9I704_9PEZI|nr:hypothetical protein P8C59_005889 [Phyllachora maydis]